MWNGCLGTRVFMSSYCRRRIGGKRDKPASGVRRQSRIKRGCVERQCIEFGCASLAKAKMTSLPPLSVTKLPSMIAGLDWHGIRPPLERFPATMRCSRSARTDLRLIVESALRRFKGR